jgi:Ca-activated chloride channel homolog
MRQVRRHVLLNLMAIAVVLGVPVVSQDRPTFRATTDVVNITATVTDQTGRAVSGLTAKDFVIYDNGVPQVTSHFESGAVPVSVGVAVDVNAVMFQGSQMPTTRAAIAKLIASPMAPDAQFSFLAFAPGLQLHALTWTSDGRALERTLADITGRREGRLLASNTALYDGVAAAVSAMSIGARAKKVLLILSGGARADLSAIPPTVLRRVLRQSDWLVYALTVDGGPLPSDECPPGVACVPQGCTPESVERGTCIERNRAVLAARLRAAPSALEEIVPETGGRTEIVGPGTNLERTFERLASELSRQYFLGFEPSGARDGRWHELRLVTTDPALSVRARAGYLAN